AQVGERGRFESVRSDARDESDVRPDVSAGLTTAPASDVESAAAVHVDPGGPGEFQENFLLQVKRGTVPAQIVPIDLAPAPVASDQDIAVLLGPALVLQEQRAGAAAAAELTQGRHDLVREVGVVLRVAVVGALDQVADPDVPSPRAIVVVVAREQ